MKYKLVARQGEVGFFVRSVHKTREEAESEKERLENDKDIQLRDWHFWIHEEGSEQESYLLKLMRGRRCWQK